MLQKRKQKKTNSVESEQVILEIIFCSYDMDFHSLKHCTLLPPLMYRETGQKDGRDGSETQCWQRR